MDETANAEVEDAVLMQKMVLGECCLQDDAAIGTIQRSVINPMFNKQMNMIRLRHRDQVQRAEKKHEDSLVGQLLDQAMEADAHLHHLFEARSSVLTKSSLDAVIARESSHYYCAVTNQGPRRWLYFGTTPDNARICIMLNETGAIASFSCERVVTRSPHIWKGSLLLGEICVANDAEESTATRAFSYEPDDRKISARKYCFVVLDIVAFAGLCGPIQQSKFDIRIKAMRSFVAITTLSWMSMKVADWQKLGPMFSKFRSAFDAVLHYEGRLVNDANLSIRHELCPSVFSGVAAIESKFPSFHIPSSLHLELLVIVLHPYNESEQRAITLQAVAQPGSSVSDCEHIRILSHTQWQRVVGDKDGLNRLRCHSGCGCFWHSSLASAPWHRSASRDDNNMMPGEINARQDNLLATGSNQGAGVGGGGLRLTQIMSMSHDDEQHLLLHGGDGAVAGDGLVTWMVNRFTDNQSGDGVESDVERNIAERMKEVAHSESIVRLKKQGVLLTEPLDGRGAPSSRTTKASRTLEQQSHHKKLVDAIALMSVVTFRIMDSTCRSSDGATMRDMIPVSCSFLHHKPAASHYDIMQTFKDVYRPLSQAGSATVAELYLKSAPSAPW